MHRKTKPTQYSAPPTHHADLLAHRQSEWPFSWHTTNQRIQWLRRPTALLLRLRMLIRIRQHPLGFESFRCSWTLQTYVFQTSSESLQMFQMSNGWASVFLPLTGLAHWSASHLFSCHYPTPGGPWIQLLLVVISPDLWKKRKLSSSYVSSCRNCYPFPDLPYLLTAALFLWPIM